jgi:hypothetical protein
VGCQVGRRRWHFARQRWHVDRHRWHFALHRRRRIALSLESARDRPAPQDHPRRHGRVLRVGRAAR